MKQSRTKLLYLVLALCIVVLGAVIFYLASNKITDDHPVLPDVSTNTTTDKNNLLDECPNLEDYKPLAPYTGPVAEVDFDTFPDARQFSGVINEGVKKGSNFAGSYSVVEWGCGTACQNEAVVNLETGKIVALGLLSTLGVSNSPESPYLVLNPRTNVERAGEMFQHVETQVYKMENDRLTYVCKASARQDEGEVCAQVVVQARSIGTGEVKTFANPCKVPDTNWEVLPAGSTEPQ